MALDSSTLKQSTIPAESVDQSHWSHGAVPGALTRRELEILQAVSEGYPDREIATRLFISRRTVTWHVTNVLNKLGVNSRTAAAVQAVRRGWL